MEVFMNLNKLLYDPECFQIEKCKWRLYGNRDIFQDIDLSNRELNYLSFSFEKVEVFFEANYNNLTDISSFHDLSNCNRDKYTPLNCFLYLNDSCRDIKKLIVSITYVFVLVLLTFLKNSIKVFKKGRNMKKLTFELCLEEAKKYMTRSEFAKKAKKEYQFVQRNRMMDKVCDHMVKPETKWTYEKCLNQAKKYKSKIDFIKNDQSAYSFARRNGLLDKVCNHMDKKLYWTEEKVRSEAKKYKTKSEFCAKSSGAYHFALRFGLLEKICSHMNVKTK